MLPSAGQIDIERLVDVGWVSIPGLYIPSKWQQEFHGLKVDEALGGGSAGPGKTQTLLFDFIPQVIVEHERCRRKDIRWGESVAKVLFLRRELGMLEETLGRAHTIFKRIDPQVKQRDDLGKPTFTFSSGLKVIFGGCKDKKDYQQYQGAQYCLEENQEIVMADGSRRAIKDVAVGEMVLTLEGPRRVSSKTAPRRALCVSAAVYRGHEYVGTQVHPTTHPLLTTFAASPRRLRSSSQTTDRSRRAFRVWHDYESLLCGDPESPGARASALGEGTGGRESDSWCREYAPLPSLTVPVVLHGPTVRTAVLSRRPPSGFRDASTRWQEQTPTRLAFSQLGAGQCTDFQQLSAGFQWHQAGSGETSLAGDAACATLGQGTAQDSLADCPSFARCHGGLLHQAEAFARAFLPSQADAAQRDPSGSPAGAWGRIPIGTPHAEPADFQNFYTRELRPVSEQWEEGTCVMTPVGWRTVVDLTIDGANHYISAATGSVNLNTYIAYDELWQFEEEQYHQINTRLRTSDRLLMRMQKIRSATNPEPNWVRRYFVDPEPKGRKVIKQTMRSDKTHQTHTVTRLFLPATLYDNPDPQFVADYERRLMNKPAHVRAAMMYGDWYASAGAYYEAEWRRDRHVIQPFEVPAGWTVFRSMDWGYKTHGVVLWWAVTPDNDMVAVDEMSFRYATATDVAKRIREIERKYGWWSTKASTGGRSKLTGPADTQLWEERGETAVSKAEEMARVGVRWQRANKKSRQNNAERFLTRLRDIDGDFPGICFMDRCKESIRTIPSIRADDNNPNEPKKGDDDHWHDAVLYACAYRASPGTDSIKPKDEDDEDKPKRRDKKRGRYGYGI